MWLSVLIELKKFWLRKRQIYKIGLIKNNMNKRQFRRLGWVFLIIAIVFLYDNYRYGCSPKINFDNLPLDEFQVDCMMIQNIDGGISMLFFVLFIAFMVLAWLEPKDKKDNKK